jgi:hypothetical protein
MTRRYREPRPTGYPLRGSSCGSTYVRSQGPVVVIWITVSPSAKAWCGMPGGSAKKLPSRSGRARSRSADSPMPSRNVPSITVTISGCESWGRATWWLGGGIGLVHGLAVLVALMPLLPGLHPRMASEHRGPEPTRGLEPPGFLALNYGHRTPLIAILAHVAYGVILGAFYRPLGG